MKLKNTIRADEGGGDGLFSPFSTLKACVHHLKGHIEYRICDRDYHCAGCEFDQYFQDQFKVYTVMTPVDYHAIDGVTFPTGYYLSRGHTWVKLEEDHQVRVGMDDFVLRLFGTPDRIELPLMGKRAERGKPLITIVRDGHDAAILSPVTGVVTAVNRDAVKQKEMPTHAPYSDGWLVMIHCDDLRDEMKTLMFMDECRAYLKQDIDALYDMLEQDSGVMAADGGNPGKDIFGNAPGLHWDKLVASFLKNC